MIRFTTRLFAMLLLVGFGLAAAPAMAQVAPGVAGPAPAEQAGPAVDPRQAARALIEILDDEAARSRLIGELGRIAAGGAVSPSPAAQPPADAGPTPETDTTLARELGEYTQGVMNEVVGVSARIWARLSNFAGLFTGAVPIKWPVLQAQLSSLAVVGLIAFAVLLGARLVIAWPMGRLAAYAQGRGLTIRLLLAAAAGVLEYLCLAVAWAAALAGVAYLGTRVAGGVGLAESIFANAFALIEGIAIAIRLVCMPRQGALRLLPMSDATAWYWNTRVSALVRFLGYGVLLVVPLFTAVTSFAVGLGARLLIVIASVVMVAVLALRNRVRVRAGLAEAATASPSVTVRTILTLVAPIWHVAVIAYAVAAFVVWMTRPFDAIGFMVTATVQSILILLVGGGLVALISRGIAGGVRLPADMRRALPHLEDRLNLLAPTVLSALRIAMAIVLVAGVLHAWQIIDVFSWAGTAEGSVMIGRIVAAVVILLIAMMIWIVATSWIEYRLRPTASRISTPRTRTLLALFRNAMTIVIAVIALMLALSELGLDIAPLIAGAGVLGLAIGFGSQKLVQDIINGAFIQFENAMNEGDVVTLAGTSGVVERLTIRSVSLRDINGVYHIIPFSSVDSVSNSTRGFAFHIADLRVSIREDVLEVKRLMGIAFERLMTTEHQASILEPLEMNGIIDFVDAAVVVRARIKTLPGKQWAVGRAYNEIVKAVFDAEGITLPAPPASVWLHDEPHKRKPTEAIGEETGDRPS